MCIQSYYDEKHNQEQEIELDLLKEIKDVGIDEWNEQVSGQSDGDAEGISEEKI